jgi:hypothetical protein
VGQREYVDRMRSDYRKAFGGAAGKHVLMDLMAHAGGRASSWPASGNPFELAFNEGKRWVYLRIREQLKADDTQLQQWFDEYTRNRVKEENQ